jgi:hypothetical protein
MLHALPYSPVWLWRGKWLAGWLAGWLGSHGSQQESSSSLGRPATSSRWAGGQAKLSGRRALEIENRSAEGLGSAHRSSQPAMLARS